MKLFYGFKDMPGQTSQAKKMYVAFIWKKGVCMFLKNMSLC